MQGRLYGQKKRLDEGSSSFFLQMFLPAAYHHRKAVVVSSDKYFKTKTQPKPPTDLGFVKT